MIAPTQARDSETVLMESIHKLADAGGSVIHIRTREPIRAATVLRKHLIGADFPYKEWDVVNGMRTSFTKENYTDHKVVGSGMDFMQALGVPIEELRNPSSIVNAASDKVHFFVYLNPQPYIANNPMASELLQQYAAILPSTNVCTILITPEMALPDVPVGTVLVTYMPTPGAAELETVLRRVVGSAVGSFSEQTDLADTDYERISGLGLGLSLYEFETFAAIAIIDASLAGEESLSPERLMDGIAVGKTQIVRQSEILELTHAEDMENIGGMQRLKDWLKLRAGCYSERAKEYGIEPPKGMVLVGVPGCLSGDTVLDYKRGNRPSGRPISMKDFHDKFNGIPTSTRGWDNVQEPTYLQSVDGEGVVFFNRVIAVLDSGIKATIRLTFDDNSHLVCTPDHPILDADWSFTKAGELQIGDSIVARGSMKAVVGAGRNLQARPPRRVTSLKYHPHGSVKTVQDGEVFYEYKRVAYARLVVEAHMNDMATEEFIDALNRPGARHRTDLVFLEPIYEVHHADENTMHDSLGNLVVMHKIQHAKHHGKAENLNVEYVKMVKLVRIEPAGDIPTFDIQMEAPANNFVANGIIVHNTGKSLAARVTASALGVPLVKLDFGSIFSKYIGDSEQRMRSALKMVEAMAPVVLFADEIDKGLGGAGGGGDSGTSSRVLGSFLSWLQDCKAPVFTVVTANRVDGLPPELLRRGRFDQVFSVGMPSDDERTEVLAIHLRKRNRDIEVFTEEEIADFRRVSSGYVPAEIESAVKDALIAGFNSRTRNKTVTMEHILTALREMVPMSVSAKDTIDRIVNWAKHNATPVSRDSESTQPAKSLAPGARVIRAGGRK